MNGTYGFAYSGVIGIGFGVFKIEDGRLTGADAAGGEYEGTVTEDPATGQISLKFSMFIPRGLQLVQGASAMEFDATRTVEFTMPPEFGDGKGVDLHIPPGPITTMVKRIPDDFAHLAAGLQVVPR